MDPGPDDSLKTQLAASSVDAILRCILEQLPCRSLDWGLVSVSEGISDPLYSFQDEGVQEQGCHED